MIRYLNSSGRVSKDANDLVVVETLANPRADNHGLSNSFQQRVILSPQRCRRAGLFRVFRELVQGRVSIAKAALSNPARLILTNRRRI